MKTKNIELPWHKFGIWEVYGDGTLKAKYLTPTGREESMLIYPDRLQESNLALQMIADTKADWNDVMSALQMACRMVGIKSIPNFLIDFE